MQLKCPQCGQEYEFDPSKEGQIFACLECGKDFVISFSKQTFEPPQKNNNTVLIVCGVVLSVIVIIIIAVLFLCFSGKKSTPENSVSAVIEQGEKKKIMEYIDSGDCLNVAKLLKNQDLNKNGAEFLFAAVNGGQIDMIQTILSCGVDINIINDKGETGLFFAAKNNNLEVFKFLLQNGARVELSVGKEDSAWGVAAEKGAIKIVEYLAVSRDYVNENSNCEKTIFRALRNGHTECAKILMEKYSINEQDKNGNTIFMAAIQNNNIEIAKIALEKFADATILNNNGESALFVALRNNNPRTLEIFDLSAENLNFQSKNGTSLPMICVKVGNHAAMKSITNIGNINLVDENGNTALYYACEKNDVEAIRFLLSKNANISSNNLENSPVYIAVIKSNVEAIDVLGADKINSMSNMVDSNGNNLLMLAVATGNEKMFDRCSLDKFDLFKKNNSGKMALDIAAENTGIKNKLLNKMDAIYYAWVVETVNGIKNQRLSEQLEKVIELKKQLNGFKQTVAYLDKIQSDINRRIVNRATSNVYYALESAKKDRYFKSAIQTMENAIAKNPEANNLQEAKDYLEELKKGYEAYLEKQAQIEKERAKIRKMRSSQLQEEITAFINSWLQDMRMDRPLNKYYGFGCTTSFFNVKEWSILGPSDENWSHFEEDIIVCVDSTNKGGTPIRVNWKITLRRDDDMQWKIADISN